MMESDFLELPWHDSVILNINIDRSNPGEVDELVLKVDWPEGNQSFLRFVKCYWILLQMNMGFNALESVLTADHMVESETLSEVKQVWKGMGRDLEGLNHFIIETNTTAGKIEIICKQLEITAVGEPIKE
ncbi:hypothetical protein [Oligoflexus tunisiensis]|uniref:hypothetical protein n=1 Tax=Oligoflexus tunisiensis TaxID=708132 RepID=UPI00114CC85F|nr:hypothetical protein [Oligoflexus tunisiensis]